MSTERATLARLIENEIIAGSKVIITFEADDRNETPVRMLIGTEGLGRQMSLTDFSQYNKGTVQEMLEGLEDDMLIFLRMREKHVNNKL